MNKTLLFLAIFTHVIFSDQLAAEAFDGHRLFNDPSERVTAAALSPESKVETVEQAAPVQDELPTLRQKLKVQKRMLSFDGVVVRHLADQRDSVISWINGKPQKPELSAGDDNRYYQYTSYRYGKRVVLGVGQRRELTIVKTNGGDR